MTVKQLREFLTFIPDDTEVYFGNEHQSAKLELWYPNGDRGFVTNEGRCVAKASVGTATFMTSADVSRDVTKTLQSRLAAERKKHPNRG